MKSKLPFRLKPLCLIAVLFMAGCASDAFHREGMALIDEGKTEEGVAKLALAQESEPGNARYRTDWLLQRDKLVLRLMVEAAKERAAGHWDESLQRYNAVLQVDSGNIRARQAINDIPLERRQIARLDEAAAQIEKGEIESARSLVTKVLIENPDSARAQQLKRKILDAMPPESMDAVQLSVKGRKPVTLQFRDANLRMVMEAIARTTGVNVIFDKDVKNDLKVTIFVRDVPVDEAIDLILMQTQTTRRVLSDNSILIYPDTEAKTKEFADLKIRRFALTNADPKMVQSMIKTLVKTKDLFVDEKSNAVVIRDTPQVIRLVEKLISAMDQPEPEVMLEVDVMEVKRDRMTALGIDLPTSFGASISGMTLQQFRNMTDADVSLTPLAVGIKAQRVNNDINDLATPRIRVRNKEKAKFLVGDRLPVVSTAAVPSTTGATPVYNTNVQYVEVGIKIEVEPTIYDDGEVAIKLNMEVSSNTGQNPDAAKNGTIAYTISTRSVNTVLRLKDGQTEIIGGLIQNQDDSNGSHIPGLGDLPGVGRLFGSRTDNKNKTEIILSITPRIVRSNRQADNSVLEMWSGSESNFRFNNRPPAAPLPTSTASAPKALTAPAAAAAPAAPAPAPGAAPGAAPVAAPATTPSPAPAAPAASAAPAAVPVAAAAAVAPAAAPAPTPKPAPAPAKPVVALQPLRLVGPANAKPGERFELSVMQPALTDAKSIQTSLSYDQDKLRLISVTEGEPSRNLTAGAHFTAEVDSPGTAQIELNSGRGMDFPNGAGTLARLQFEVLPGEGVASITLGQVRVTTAAEAQFLPPTEPIAVAIQAEQ